MKTPRAAHPRRKNFLAAALLAGLMATGDPAAGGTIGISGSTLIAGAEPTDGSIVLNGFLSLSGTDLLFQGVDFAIVTPGCTGDTFIVRCALSGFTSVVIIGGDGDDAVTLSTIVGHAFAITIVGGAGDDILFGSQGNDAIYGGAGDDVLFGEDGIDLLSGGPGDNSIIGEEESMQPEPVVTPLPRGESVPAPGGLPLLVGALGALAMTRRKQR